MSPAVREALVYGLLLGLKYSPIPAVVGAAPAAALFVARVKRVEARVWAGSIVAIAWLLGDGMRVIARARDAYDGQLVLSMGEAPASAVTVALVTWAVVSLGVGYALPVWAGVYVGRRVTHGTGWLTAGSIAVAASLAISTVAAYVAR